MQSSDDWFGTETPSGAKWIADDPSLSEGGGDVLYPYIARPNPPAMEDFLYSQMVSAVALLI